MIGNISKLYKIQGTSTINANTTGNNTVQQKDINWSKRILGKDALTHINVNTINELFIPRLKILLIQEYSLYLEQSNLVLKFNL